MKKYSDVVVIKEFQVNEKIFKVGEILKYITRLRNGHNFLKCENEGYLECSDETLENFEEVVEED